MKMRYIPLTPVSVSRSGFLFCFISTYTIPRILRRNTRQVTRRWPILSSTFVDSRILIPPTYFGLSGRATLKPTIYHTENRLASLK